MHYRAYKSDGKFRVNCGRELIATAISPLEFLPSRIWDCKFDIFSILFEIENLNPHIFSQALGNIGLFCYFFRFLPNYCHEFLLFSWRIARCAMMPPQSKIDYYEISEVYNLAVHFNLISCDLFFIPIGICIRTWFWHHVSKNVPN